MRLQLQLCSPSNCSGVLGWHDLVHHTYLTHACCFVFLPCRLWSRVVAGAPRENEPFDKEALPSFSKEGKAAV